MNNEEKRNRIKLIVDWVITVTILTRLGWHIFINEGFDYVTTIEWALIGLGIGYMAVLFIIWVLRRRANNDAQV